MRGAAEVEASAVEGTRARKKRLMVTTKVKEKMSKKVTEETDTVDKVLETEHEAVVEQAQ